MLTCNARGIEEGKRKKIQRRGKGGGEKRKESCLQKKIPHPELPRRGCPVEAVTYSRILALTHGNLVLVEALS